jgi:hypothetical protein
MGFIGVTYYIGAWCTLKGYTAPAIPKKREPVFKENLRLFEEK